MGRRVIIVFLMFCAALLVFAGCTKKEIVSPGIGDDQVEEPPLPENLKDTLYVTGVEYPDGYDWEKDTEYGQVRCVIFLEREGERILTIPVGHDYEVSSDPDMHRCFDGHLYTDYSTDSETVFKKDGVEIFRYDGREHIVSFYVFGNDVFTLGMPRSSSVGLYFRKNGVLQESFSKGVPVSGFHEDADNLYFSYCVGNGTDSEFYMYAGGKKVRIADGAFNVFSAVMSGGNICFVAGYRDVDDGIKYRCCYGNESFLLDLGGFTRLSDCKLWCQKDGPVVRAICSDGPGSSSQYSVWDAGGVKYRMKPGYSPLYSFMSEGEVYDIMSLESAVSVTSLCVDGVQKHTYGRDRRIIGAVPAAVVRGEFYFAFSGSAFPRRPFLASGSDVKMGAFNGFYTGVTAW